MARKTNTEMRGKASFENFLRVCSTGVKEGLLPSWVRRCRKGTRKEDGLGIDAWIDTDFGPVPIQIKSSLQAKDKHYRRKGYHKILCLVTPATRSDSVILQEIAEELTRVRSNYKKYKPSKKETENSLDTEQDILSHALWLANHGNKEEAERLIETQVARKSKKTTSPR